MKIRTDFVTNSSSANYTVSLALVSDDQIVRLGGIWACGDGDYGRNLALSVSFGEEYPSVSDGNNIEALCEMLFENIEIEACYYDNTQTKMASEEDDDELDEDDDDWDENDDWDEDIDPRDYNAKELYPEKLASIKEDCKTKGITIQNLKWVRVKEDISASGDGPIWDNILDDEYCGEKCILTIYDANKSKWQRIAMIEGEDEDGNCGFLVSEQDGGEYKYLSPNDLGVTAKKYKKMSVSEALDNWAKLQGIYEEPKQQKPRSYIAFTCSTSKPEEAMAYFVDVFNKEWNTLVEKTKKVFVDCNVDYNPLDCTITGEGFEASIGPVFVPYGDEYCEREVNDDPLEKALDALRTEYISISYEGHIQYVINKVKCVDGEVEPSYGEFSNYKMCYAPIFDPKTKVWKKIKMTCVKKDSGQNCFYVSDLDTEEKSWLEPKDLHVSKAEFVKLPIRDAFEKWKQVYQEKL